MYYTYVLQSIRKSYLYIGYSTNLEKRFKQHNNGECLASKRYAPYKLIFYEAFVNRKDAKNREKYLKSGWGRRTIKKMLKNYFKNDFK